MKRTVARNTLFSTCALLASVVATNTPFAHGASLYWDGTGSSWNSAASWSTASNATTPDPIAFPGIGDLAIFNTTGLNSGQFLTLDAPQSAAGLSFVSTGSVGIGSGADNLTLGSSGISIAAGTGAVIIIDNITLLPGSQTWVNNSSNSMTINTLTRSAGATINFSGIGGFSTSTANAYGTDPSTVNTAAIMGGWATVNGNTWAVSGSGTTAGAITGLGASGYFTGGLGGAGVNEDYVSGALSGTITWNSLRFNTTTSSVALPAGLTTTITSGGILETSNVGNLGITISGTGASLTTTAPDLVIINNSTAFNGTLTVSVPVTGAIGLTKAGPGTVLDSATNTFSGKLSIVGGLFRTTADTGLGSVPSSFAAHEIILNGGGLAFNATTTINPNRGIDVGPVGGTIAVPAVSVTYAGSIGDMPGGGPGNLTLASYSTTTNQISTTSGGTLYLTAAQSFTGTMNVNVGTLSVGSTAVFASGLGLGGGTLSVQTGRSTSLSFTATTVNTGYSVIAANVGLGGNSLNLGAITRNGGSIVNFTTAYPTTGTLTTATPNSNFAGGQQSILGGWAIITNGNTGITFATSGVGTGPFTMASTGLTSYASDLNTAGADIDVPSGAPSNALTATVSSVNSLHFAAGNPTITLTSPFTIATGGVIFGLIGAGTTTFVGDSINTLTSGNGHDLIFGFNTANSTTVNIAAPIVDPDGNTHIGLTMRSYTSTPTIILSAPNTFTGEINVLSGTLSIANSSALQFATLNYNNGNGTVSFTGGGITSAILGALKGGIGAPTLTLPSTNNYVFSVGNTNQNTTFAGVIAGMTGTGESFAKIGSGTLTLLAPNTYRAATSITGGTLQLAPGASLGCTSAIFVGATGTLDMSGQTLALGTTAIKTLTGVGTILGPVALNAGATLAPGTTISSGLPTVIGTLSTGAMTLASGGTLSFMLATGGASILSPGLSSRVAVNGALTFPSTGLNLSLVDNFTAIGSTGTGYYQLFSATTLTGFTGTTFNIPTVPATLAGRTLTFTVFNGGLYLKVADPIAALTWNGAVSASWDTVGTANNWANGSTAAAYTNPSSVTFNDTDFVTGSPLAAGKYAVTIQAGGVTPALLHFNNSNGNYVLSNVGGDTVGISGNVVFNKDGTGTVSLLSPNSFTGIVSLNAGAINIASAAAFASSPSVQVLSTAALQLSNNISAGIPVALTNGTLENLSDNNTYSGTVTLNAGGGKVQSDAGLITLSGTTAVATAGQQIRLGGAGNGIVTGIISGTGSINKVDAGTWTLANNNLQTGGMTITAGKLSIAVESNLGPATVPLTFAGTGTLQLTTPGTTIARSVVLASQGNIDLGGSSATFSGVLSGAGRLVNTNGTLTLTNNASTFGGGATISSGKIIMTHAGALGSGPATFASAGTVLQIQPPANSASIAGFGGSSNTGWTMVTGNSSISPYVSGPGTSADVLTITSGASYNNNAAWYTSNVPYTNGFTASFIYTNVGTAGSPAGAAFVLTTLSAVTITSTAIGTGSTNSALVGGFGSNLGYAAGGQQRTVPNPSVAFGWNTTSNASVVGGVNGVLGSSTSLGAPTFLSSGDPIQFTISSDGAASNVFTYTLTDTVTSAFFSGSVSLGSGNTLASVLGNGGLTHLGFTAGTTTPNVEVQTITNFQYSDGFSGNFGSKASIVVQADSTLDASYSGGTISFTGLSIGANTLTVSNLSGGGAKVNFGPATISGNATIAPAAMVTVGISSVTSASTFTLNGDTTSIVQFTAGSAPSTLIQLGGLVITSGSVDLTNHDMLLDGGTTQLNALKAAVAGVKFYSSSTGPGISTSVMVIMGSADYELMTGSTTFDGAALDANSVLVKYTYAGDANFDGVVSADDYLEIDYGFLLNKTGWIYGDFNDDGTVDAADYAIIDNNYLNQSGTLATGEIALHASEFGSVYTDALLALNPNAIPEPASLVLLSMGMTGLLARRRR